MEKIFLLGFMGSGKTTFGRRLAKRLHYQYIDLDQHISQMEGSTIEEIFDLHGEAHFRDLETTYLNDICSYNNIVISLGGGTPIKPENWNLIQDHITIYLKLPAKALYNRLKASKNPRPLVKNLKNGELLEFINRKLAEREPIYEKAKIIVDGHHPNVDTIISCMKNLC